MPSNNEKFDGYVYRWVRKCEVTSNMVVFGLSMGDGHNRFTENANTKLIKKKKSRRKKLKEDISHDENKCSTATDGNKGIDCVETTGSNVDRDGFNADKEGDNQPVTLLDNINSKEINNNSDCKQAYEGSEASEDDRDPDYFEFDDMTVMFNFEFDISLPFFKKT